MSGNGLWPWSELGLAGPAERKAIKRGYAVRLKALNQETEQAAFEHLRAAYEAALDHAARDEGGAGAVFVAASVAPATSPPASADDPLHGEIDVDAMAKPARPKPDRLLPDDDPVLAPLARDADNVAMTELIRNLRGDNKVMPGSKLTDLAHSPMLVNPANFAQARSCLNQHFRALQRNGRSLPLFDKHERTCLDAAFGWYSDRHALPTDLRDALVGSRMSFLWFPYLRRTPDWASTVIRIAFTSRNIAGWLVVMFILWSAAFYRWLVEAPASDELWWFRWGMTALPLIIPIAAILAVVLLVLVGLILLPLEVFATTVADTVRRRRRLRRAIALD